jgi:hypothetical protein
LSERKEEQSDEGTDITPKIMELADAKFKVRSELKIWNAPSESEEKIIALESKVVALEAEKTTTTNHKPDDAKKIKGKGFKPEWMIVPPVKGETTKEANGKQFFWCKTHNAWGRHTPGVCEGLGFLHPHHKAKESAKEGGSSQKLNIAQGLQALMEEEDSE